MTKILALNKKKSFILKSKAPYNFDASFYKPSHFPSSDNIWEKGRYWITMIWKSKRLGLKFEDIGTVNEPKMKVNVYSQKELSKDFIDSLIPEIRWRFNFNQDISDFCEKFKDDKILGSIIKKW